MKTLPSLLSVGLKIEDGKLFYLDQTLLPDQESWKESRSPNDMIAAIQTLQVRGAPLIGVAAALELARFALTESSSEKVRAAGAALRAARPTAVNLMHAIDSCLDSLREGPEALIQKAIFLFQEDVRLCESMAEHGAALVQNGENLLTHCNAGALATVGRGTAVGVITKAWEQGKRFEVFVDETRPLLQGGRLTAWELKKAGIPYRIVCDNMSAAAMSRGMIQRIFVGADRIAANGDFANKIGTYGVAISAHYHQIPFHPVAPKTTVDLKALSGKDIPVEERDPKEVRGAKGSFGDIRWAPSESRAWNPSFDVTPASLVTSLVLDSGVYSSEQLSQGILKKTLS